MCGIAGWLGHVSDPETRAARLADALRHRGPDAQGYRCWSDAALVNTRLKVIDVSTSGDQPLANETSAVWAVLNGEIYNHRELQHWLEARGHAFQGHSDTEVLPHLYEEYGVDLARHLRGMFAFAVYDSAKHRLVVSRDRFGIKPLFYSLLASRDSAAFAFASELNALIALPGVDDRPNRQALFDLLALTFVPGPQTFYRGVAALEPGETLEVSFGADQQVSVKTHRYHRWEISADADLTLEDAVSQADDLLMAAVGHQVESEVPLGSFLSGGIDSSLVSAAARSLVGPDLRSFNVKFWDKAYDETWSAQAVSSHIGSIHETLEMESGGLSWDQIVDLLAHAGQPFGDTSLFATNAVCRLMRQHVTVALSGDGGDEGFGGYPAFRLAGRVAKLQLVPEPLWAMGSACLGLLHPVAPKASRVALRARQLARADDVEIVQHLMSYVRPAEQLSLMNQEGLEPTRRWFEPTWPNPPLGSTRADRLSTVVTEAYARLVLPGDYLFKVDTASMKENLEVRVPMLDEDLFDFALSLPRTLKTRRGTGKVVLRELAKRNLPTEVATKPKKGFGIPMDSAVDGNFKDGLEEYLLDPGSVLKDLLGSSSYVALIRAFCRDESIPGISREGLYRRVFTLLSVQVTCDAAAARRGERTA